MTPLELQRYLHEHIPLSSAMQASVVASTPEAVELRAPLEPNINHRATAFGGSVSALAILAAWSLLHLRLKTVQKSCRLVIQRNSMEYELPIAGAFTARSTLEEPAEWEAFLRILARKGRARIAVRAIVASEGAAVGRFVGEFVALTTES